MIPCDLFVLNDVVERFGYDCIRFLLWKIGCTEYFCFKSIGRVILLLPYAIQFGLI
jgi:hypothetical protein